VFDIGDIFDCAELIGRHKLPRGPRLGIVTNAGGPGVMATDALIAHNGVLAELAPDTISALDQNLPPSWSRGNPVDVLGDAPSKRLAKAVKIVSDDAGVDALLVILTPQSMTNATAAAREVAKISETCRKPILAAWLGGKSMKEGVDVLMQNNIPTYTTPEQAVRAFMFLTSYSRNLETLYETPRDIPVTFSLDKKIRRDQFEALTPDNHGILSETDSKKILASYGVPVTLPEIAGDVDAAVAAAERIGYPVVMKIHSPDITHKTDVGGVILNLQTVGEVRRAFERMMDDVAGAVPDARRDGVTIQKMADPHGTELILGIKQDPVFGSVIMTGFGGTGAEIIGDRSLAFPPLNERLTRRMLETLKTWPLLRGYRGRPLVNLDRLIEIIMRVSYMAADYPEIRELDINPLRAGSDDAVALDARIVVGPPPAGPNARPYAHLALRPYPDELRKDAVLKDGTPVRLRPIRPEDEPMWMELLGSCSRESIYMRFRYMFHWESHAVASRYCYIDYDREIAIVAELEDDGRKRLAGVGRLVCEPGMEDGEYAVLIADAWQNRGLGGMLTDFCMEIARRWGLKNVVAQTTTDNARMINLFKNRQFEFDREASGELLDVRKPIETTDA
nr:GNAT family N-acetyltransferase [bacterium]